jgi:hypothetical protein
MVVEEISGPARRRRSGERTPRISPQIAEIRVRRALRGEAGAG